MEIEKTNRNKKGHDSTHPGHHRGHRKNGRFFVPGYSSTFCFTKKYRSRQTIRIEHRCHSPIVILNEINDDKPNKEKYICSSIMSFNILFSKTQPIYKIAVK